MANEAVDFVDIALLRVRREDQSLVDMGDGISFSCTVSKEKKVVNTMNRRRVARGYRTATKAVSWEIEVPIRKNQPQEVDWRKVKDDDEIIQIIYEEGDGGARRVVVDAVVNEVAADYNESGESVLRVSGVAIDERADA